MNDERIYCLESPGSNCDEWDGMEFDNLLEPHGLCFPSSGLNVDYIPLLLTLKDVLPPHLIGDW